PPPTAAQAAALNQPVVGMAATASGKGYWQVARDGGVFAFGDAAFLGSMGGTRLNQPIVGMSPTPTGKGYWLVASDGGIFSFGDATFAGSTGDIRLNQPIVGMSPTPSGKGYWLVARDGGIFAFGDAGFVGSTGDIRLNQPVVAMAPTPTGKGYWLVASDGGIFSFGDAAFVGSTGDIHLNQPIVGMASRPTGKGYWLVASDGGIFAFGDAPFLGSAGAIKLNQPVVGMDSTPAGDGYWLVASDGGVFTYGNATFAGSPQEQAAPADPTIQVATVVGGLDHPWDIGFTPDGTMLFTERSGKLKARLTDGTVRLLADIGPDLYTQGEDGLLGMAVDPNYAGNRAVYTCATNASPREVRVMRWSVASDYSSATRTNNPLLGGIPSAATIHNGCRPRFGPDGMLWVGTGDSAQGPNPQSTSSLGGKVLRIRPADGGAAPGNPFGNAIYTLGHRNVQGLAWRPGTDQMFSVEHGPDRDDEVNRLRPGGNGGWDPNNGGSYDQSRPMTDLAKFPDAMRPVWTSGSPTVAPSGATFVTGSAWGGWNGALVVACLKGSQLLVMNMDAEGNVARVTKALTNQGRLRSVVQGPDGSLYVSTDNGSGADKILRVSP
ncbi:MAG: aldose sugar dehydrogenase, partial [Actinomycetota bacterium]|nr:aldose sugar dehydrogenase [Actinomycetota bacterium]